MSSAPPRQIAILAFPATQILDVTAPHEVFAIATRLCQFSNSLASQAAETATLRDLQAWIADHLDHDLTVAALAERTFMSERRFETRS